MPTNEPTLGEYLKQVRLSKGLSLRQAAKVVGITHSRVDEVERMVDARSLKPFVPSYVTVVKFAKAYDLSPDELLRRAGYEPGIELEPEEWVLIKGYRGLPQDRRQRLLEALRGLEAEGSA